jgi:leucyl aminopeptidase (aminopeptidase T)
MSESLSVLELEALVRRVFAPGPEDRKIAILVDLPDAAVEDTAAWLDRREMALEWVAKLRQSDLGMDRVDLFAYPNVRTNNADLPSGAMLCAVDDDDRAENVPIESVLRDYSIILAMTQLSASAPLKIAAPRLRFRAASMPGFSRAMLPALRLDFDEVQRRCHEVKERLDAADSAQIFWRAGGVDGQLHLDLRGRVAVASGGVIREPGIAGNLPSGETFIVPYEGEREGDPSRTAGKLPLEIDGELMFLTIESNRVVDVEGSGEAVERQRRAFQDEPAFANIAELGLGILGDYGVRAVGETLLDEKLGLHIAFGRSDHFPGGTVGTQHFSAPNRVAHIDYVYVRESQPQVQIVELSLQSADRDDATLMLNGVWTIQ